MESAKADIDQRRTSFWKLLSEYRIIIPIIQRDYAQGRNNPKANIIREEILINIHRALTNDSPLDFDFVYGTITADKIFYPLDGQQRLTTLFLLHWYLAVRDGQIDGTIRKTLKKFTYKTRISSREFCKKLADSSFDFENYDDSNNLSNAIADANWFFIAWHHDPTIQAMLNMLNSIHKTFSKSERCFEKLTDIQKCPIKFQLIPLEKFGLTDDLYIRMNARGKLLTDFEIFKARFEHFLDDEYPELKQEFVKKIDGGWTHFFWGYREHNVIDTPFMRFFWFITEMLYFYDEERGGGASIFKYDKENNPTINYDLLKKVYRKKENIKKLFSYIDILIKIDGDNFFKQMPSLKNNEARTIFLSCVKGVGFFLREKIILFTIMEYHRKTLASSNNDENLNDFVRVVQNFLQYVRQQDGDEFAPDILVKHLHDYLRSINNFISEKNIYDILATQDLCEKISGQNFKDAYEHEKIKAECITKNPKWRPLIHRIEAHPCLNGLIYNILYPNDIEKTEKYFNTLTEIWDGKQKTDGIKISRAWLSVADYKIETKAGYDIYALGFGGSNNDRDSKKWHFIFTTTEQKSTKIKENIGTFFDTYNDTKKKNVAESLTNNILQTIIDDYVNKQSKSESKDWRWYFIRHEGIFSNLDPSNHRYFHITGNGNTILSLKSNNHRGLRYHLYLYYISYVIASKNKSPYSVSKTGQLKGWSTPCLQVGKEKGQYIQMLDKSDENGSWEIRVSKNWALPSDIKGFLTKVSQTQSNDSADDDSIIVYELKKNSSDDRIDCAISFFKQILTP